MNRVETVIVGGGQAGLATSYHLRRAGREHVVLEQAAAPGNVWRNDRWDSFTLVTPNWSFRIPGAEDQGSSPDGYLPRAEVVARLECYVEEHDLPVRFGVRVESVEPKAANAGYVVRTPAETIEATNVVIATGLFQRPRLLPLSAEIPSGVEQLHSGQYRNPGALQAGAVLVVGSAQSGCQIAQELYQSGRKVYLCVGGAGRVPRRYRGRDIFEWFDRVGLFDRSVEDLPSPRAKFAGNPHVSGRDGGQNLNLHQFARDGVVLLGHLRGVSGDVIQLAPDRNDGLAKADAFEAQITALIDRYVTEHGIDAPVETLPHLDDGFTAEEITELSLSEAGITTVVWAIGYEFDFSLVKLPVVDQDGYPLQNRGATAYPGLFFVGMPWIDKWKSGLFIGVGEHARHIADAICSAE